MEQTKWKTIQIRTEKINTLKKIIKSKLGEELGLTNTAQAVDFALQKLINDIELKRFEHFGLTKNIIRVLDNNIGKTGDIINIKIKNGEMVCAHCAKNHCVHTKFICTDKLLVNKLKENGVRISF